MYLGLIAEHQQLVEEMNRKQIYEARDGTPLHKLHISKLRHEYERIKDQRELQA
ncbi:hypothetical protein [Alkalicoccus luteus]|uniref:Uncharacterized protein n=1 Tax=Alkalicoccus luteus TaxID=1237094 RepID=A0A969PR83_9BACI|nr:hypothetical protein [Alkalicoccus luteus]NJP37903.1 hypothetical protein [Alkalicoccus luteus]